MLRALRGGVLALLALAGAGLARAEPIPLSGYDIENAIVSGFEYWQHQYTGNIAVTRPFRNGMEGWEAPGEVANYTGGTGTLADGVISELGNETQLFATGNPDGQGSVDAVITLKLAKRSQVQQVRFDGGNIFWSTIPGNIISATVEIGSIVLHLATMPAGFPGLMGPVDDILDLTGTGLDRIPTDTVVLRDITVSSNRNEFSLTEIELFGLDASQDKRVLIDVRPRQLRDAQLNEGKFLVAILSTEDFSAEEVDPPTLTLGRTGDEQSLVDCRGIGLKYTPSHYWTFEGHDINKDGRPDLVCRFDMKKTGLLPGDGVVNLKAKTWYQYPLRGEASVEVK